uniref:Peptidylprolyl isomerase n=1 Tax=Rhabditophanes sp. KR3021 TaxID=114890 RepID=A0AC35UI23_9BILA
MSKLFIVLSALCITTYCDQRSWELDDGTTIEIIKKIPDSKCEIYVEHGDHVEQFFKLTDKQGRLIGSNFGQKPFSFEIGGSKVISSMSESMHDMCIKEQRKIVIPGDAFEEDELPRGAKSGDDLYYFIELKSIFRPVPGESWYGNDGLHVSQTHVIEPSLCKKAEHGDKVHQQYSVWLETGQFIDSSHSRGKPFIFTIGAGQVIPGVEKGMEGMCEGERRKLFVPAGLAYGEKGRASIPPSASLTFEIELEKVIKANEEL